MNRWKKEVGKVSKKIITGILVSSFIVSQSVYAEKVENQENSKQQENISSDLEYLDEQLSRTKENLTEKEKRTVEKIQNIARDDGDTAAECLNNIEDDELYEVALKEVLDEYYSEEETKEEQVEKFTETVDERAEKTLLDYEQAEEERSNSDNLEYEVGKILVTFNTDIKEEDIAKIAEHMGSKYSILNNQNINEDLPEHTLDRLETIKNQDFPIIAYMELATDQTVEKATNILNTLSCVSKASANGISMQVETLKTNLDVNDPDVEKQTYLQQIHLPKVWKTWLEANGYSESVDIAVIDTGIDILHEDLKKQYIPERSVSLVHKGTDIQIERMNEENDYLKGVTGADHGTHVAGIIAARSNNQKGVVGIASIANSSYDVRGMRRIMAINASTIGKDKEGKNVCVFYDSDLIVAINYAVNNGARVINMSLGGETYNAAMQEIINYAKAADVIICAAAGNKGENITHYPAAYENVIAVGSVDGNNNRSTFSNMGIYLDIVAPGEDIYNCLPNSKYTYATGTSMASPIVAVSAALLCSMNFEEYPYRWSSTEVEEFLFSTATDIATAGKDIYTGNGLINLNLALESAKAKALANTKPKKVKATIGDYQSIKLRWEAVAWANRYQIYCSTSENGTYSKIKVLYDDDVNEGDGIGHYKDTGLNTGQTYYYKIRAVSPYQDKFKYSAYSDIVKEIPVLNIPQIGLAASTGKITISWGKIDGAEGYGIFRSESKDGTYTRVKKITSGSILSFSDTSVKKGKKYYYKVRAFRNVNGTTVKSQFSEIGYKTAK